MGKNWSLSLVTGFICIMLGAPNLVSAKTPPASAEAFAAAPVISRVAISADGNRIAFGYTTATGESQVRILDIPTNKTSGLTSGPTSCAVSNLKMAVTF